MHSGIEIGLKKHAAILDQPRKKRLGSTTTQHAYSPSLPFLPGHLSHIEASKPRKKDCDLGRSTNLVVLLPYARSDKQLSTSPGKQIYVTSGLRRTQALSVYLQYVAIYIL